MQLTNSKWKHTHRLMIEWSTLKHIDVDWCVGCKILLSFKPSYRGETYKGWDGVGTLLCKKQSQCQSTTQRYFNSYSMNNNVFCSYSEDDGDFSLTDCFKGSS